MKWAVSTLVSDMVKAIERSKTRAASGGTTLSATRPATALPFSTCLTVMVVGNVSGAQTVNSTTMTSHTYTAPMFRNDRAAAARGTGVPGTDTADLSGTDGGSSASRVGVDVMSLGSFQGSCHSVPSMACTSAGSVMSRPLISRAIRPSRTTRTRVHSGGGHDDAHALVGLTLYQGVQLQTGGDVHARRGFAQRQHRRALGQTAGHDDLLLVAPAQRGDPGAGWMAAGRTHTDPPDPVLHQGRLAASAQPPGTGAQPVLAVRARRTARRGLELIVEYSRGVTPALPRPASLPRTRRSAPVRRIDVKKLMRHYSLKWVGV
jgi:hypothetical protein